MCLSCALEVDTERVVMPVLKHIKCTCFKKQKKTFYQYNLKRHHLTLIGKVLCQKGLLQKVSVSLR